MAVHVRSAGAADVPALVALMQAFYAEADFPLPAAAETSRLRPVLFAP